MDLILQILQSIGYLLLLVILAVFWRKTFSKSELRRFWGLLALAWTINLFGNIAWIVHELVTGTALDTLSLVDLFYVLHYVLVGLVLWLYPGPMLRRAWFWICGVMLVVNAVVWAVYFNPAMALRGGDWTGFLGLAMYPVLDAGIITLAWLRVRAARQSLWSRYTFLLFCAVTSYGIANTFNLTEYVFPPISGGILPNIFWILSDVFLLILVLGPEIRDRARNEK